jgi:type IV pilus assembly protein PilE
MHHALRPTKLRAGFTLIELMIVVGVAAVLALVAYPSYQESVRKGRRADAIAGLNRLQQLQERVRAQQPSYAAAVASLPGPPPAVSPMGYYGLTIDAASPSSYRMTAAAGAGSPQFGDTNCRGLRVEMAGGTINYLSLNAAGVVDATNANRCWPR